MRKNLTPQLVFQFSTEWHQHITRGIITEKTRALQQPAAVAVSHAANNANEIRQEGVTQHRDGGGGCWWSGCTMLWFLVILPNWEWVKSDVSVHCFSAGLCSIVIRSHLGIAEEGVLLHQPVRIEHNGFFSLGKFNYLKKRTPVWSAKEFDLNWIIKIELVRLQLCQSGSKTLNLSASIFLITVRDTV